MGEHSQNEPFAPITTNPANIGTKDLNGDGVANTQDDPTTTAILPQLGLDATSDISVLGLRLTSKPTDKVRINASYRVYEYDGGRSSLVIPGRTEYIESRIKTDFKGTSLAFVPHYYERSNLKVEGIIDASDDLRLMLFWKRDSYDWNQYASTSGNVSREVGNRAVSGTDDDSYGLRVFWDGPDWLDARFDYSTSERDYSGAYQIAFSGENEGVRQYDIARRDRDAYELRFDLYPKEGITLGVEVRSWEDDYPDTVYGYLDGSSDGWTVDANFAISETVDLFLYAGSNEADTNMHLRTKCSNCSPPTGLAPWNVPNYDWFPSYEDEDTSFGAELSFRSDDGRSKFHLSVDYLDAAIEQRNVNPGTPRDLGKPNTPPVGVSQAFDFPDQSNTFTEIEAKYVRKLTDTMSCGLMYTFEDWDLTDFQLQTLDAYGPNHLSVDDATRYMFLDAWYGSFDAHVGQLFVKMSF